MPDPLDFGDQPLIPSGPLAIDLRVAPACGMQAVTRWGDLQEFADRLDPERVSVAVGLSEFLCSRLFIRAAVSDKPSGHITRMA